VRTIFAVIAFVLRL